MSYSSHALPNPSIRLPNIALPKPRLPHWSPGFRAILMMGLLMSPVFLCDYIGYGIERLTHTPAQMAEMRQAGEPMLKNVEIFAVACTDPSTSAAEQKWWTDFAAQKGWPMYPQAGKSCFRPEYSLLGVVGLKTFNVACPKMVLSVADRGRWMNFAAGHGWDPYPEAGADCVDP